MALDAALADAQAAKRMRLTPELAGRTFQYQSVHVNQWGQLWPPITMVLGLDGLITVAGFAPHGEWKVTDDLELSLTFHCHGDPTKVKQSVFSKRYQERMLGLPCAAYQNGLLSWCRRRSWVLPAECNHEASVKPS